MLGRTLMNAGDADRGGSGFVRVAGCGWLVGCCGREGRLGCLRERRTISRARGNGGSSGLLVE